MATETKLITAEELIQMLDDGYRYEIVRGDLIEMAPPGLVTEDSLATSYTNCYEPRRRLFSPDVLSTVVRTRGARPPCKRGILLSGRR